MQLLDSSVWIAYYHENDSQHEKASNAIRDKGGNNILVNDCIIDEVATVLQAKAGHEKAKLVLDALLNTDSVSFKHTSEEEFFEIADYFKKQKEKLSFTDCSIVLLAKKSGAEVITFDRRLGAAIEKLGV